MIVFPLARKMEEVVVEKSAMQWPAPPADFPGLKTILLTAHRRENFGAPLRDAFTAIRAARLQRHAGQFALLAECMNEGCRRPVRKRIPHKTEIETECFECKATVVSHPAAA